MRVRAKVAKAGFMLAGLLMHITRGAAAMLPGPAPSAPVLPPLPPREPAPDSMVDNSRLRLAESAEPPRAEVWTAGMRAALSVGSGADENQPLLMALAAPTAAAPPANAGAPGNASPAKPVAAKGSPAPLTAAQISQAQAELNKALLPLHMTEIQQHSVRDYVGNLKAEIRYIGNFDGKQILALSNPTTHKYVGEIAIQLGPDDTVIVSKVAGARFDTGKTVKVPVMSHATQTAQKVIKGQQPIKELQNAILELARATEHEVAVPAIAFPKTSRPHPARAATAVFHPDGSGVEQGWGARSVPSAESTPVRSASSAGLAKAPTAATRASSPPVSAEGYVNFFSPPAPDSHGQQSRQVVSATYITQVSQTQSSVKGVGASASGGSVKLNFSPTIVVAPTVQNSNGNSVFVPITGIANASASQSKVNDDDSDDDAIIEDGTDDDDGNLIPDPSARENDEATGDSAPEPKESTNPAGENDENAAPATESQEPTTDENAAPATESQEPTTDENAAPATENQEPATETQEPTTNDNPPTADTNANPAVEGTAPPAPETTEPSDGSTDALHGFLKQYPDKPGDQDQPSNDNQTTQPGDTDVPGDEQKRPY